MPFNRTLLELKFIVNATWDIAKNLQSHLTGIEIGFEAKKLLGKHDLQSHLTGIEIGMQLAEEGTSRSFNRTLLELKYGYCHHGYSEVLPFNRTLLELKFMWQVAIGRKLFNLQSHLTGIEIIHPR